MSMINCPKCGNPNPEGANFCNKCGRLLRQKSEKTCSACGKTIPSNSVYCPICGADLQTVPQKVKIPGSSFPNPVPSPKIEDYEEEAPKKSNKVRNWTIGITIVVVLAMVGAFIAYVRFNTFGEADNTATDTVAVTLSPDEAVRIFDETLASQNMDGDRYTTAYAIQMDSPKGNRIIGLRVLSSNSGRSAYKIFEMVDTGSVWTVVNHIDRFVDNASIITDRQDLMMAFEDVPKAVNINGNDYFYFVYMTRPVGPSIDSKAKLIFALYNVGTHDVITLDMAGELVVRDNQNFFKGEFTNARSSVEAQFLQNEAAKAKVIYKPTPEELAMDDPMNAAQKWVMNNNDKVNEVRSTMNAVKMDVTFYDKPIFEKANIADGSTVSNDSYLFVCAKNGTVYGFNKKARTYFVVYAPVNHDRTSKTSLTLNADGTLNVAAENINFNFDPRNLEATSAE